MSLPLLRWRPVSLPLLSWRRCLWVQGMQLHRQAAEERLANNNMGQSFLARQRQVHSRRAQTINTLHTSNSNRWSCRFYTPGHLAVLYTLHAPPVAQCRWPVSALLLAPRHLQYSSLSVFIYVLLAFFFFSLSLFFPSNFNLHCLTSFLHMYGFFVSLQYERNISRTVYLFTCMYFYLFCTSGGGGR